MNILLFINFDLKHAESTLQRIKKILQQHKAVFYIYGDVPAEYADYMCLPEGGLSSIKIDFAMVCGGDGSFLHAGNVLLPYQIPLIGVNLGQLGMLMDLPPNNLEIDLPRLLNGQYQLEKRSVIQGVINDGKSDIAINDICISKPASGRMVALTIYCHDQEVYTTHADGIVVSTGTGSTAYNLSAHGPIVHPRLQAIIVTPINPQNPAHKSIVLPHHSSLSITIRDTAGCVLYDGQRQRPISAEGTLLISTPPEALIMMHPICYSYLSLIAQKLHWE